MNHKNLVIVAVLLAILALVVLGMSLKRVTDKASLNAGEPKLEIAATFYPLYFFASEIGKDQVNVTNLTPAGAEPHDYEPNAQDIAKLEQMPLLLANGAGFEPWLDDVEVNLESKQTRVARVAESLISLELEEEGKSMSDPHVWLDPILAQKEIDNITHVMSYVDPVRASTYERNATDLQSRLLALHEEFSRGLKNCKHRKIVTSHQAFGYVAKRYGLEQVAIAGLSPEQEPTPTELAEVADFAKANNIKFIFFETLVSPRLAETLAQEVGAEVLVFDPLEGLSEEDQRAGKDYFSVQRENLKNLQTALECS